ncbi:MAG: ribonuclease P protein component [Candidatus Paceibacterota bacterium]
MLPKKNRADKKAIEKIFKEGIFLNSPHLTFRFIKTRNKDRKISFIVPKSVAKLAVKRNLLRRRGYGALEKVIDTSPIGLVGAFIFNKYQNDISILENEIKNILSKIN